MIGQRHRVAFLSNRISQTQQRLTLHIIGLSSFYLFLSTENSKGYLYGEFAHGPVSMKAQSAFFLTEAALSHKAANVGKLMCCSAL